MDRYSRECLSPEEQQRLGAYRSREAAERYVMTRSLVRLVLGERLGRAARDLGVTRTASGKPVLDAGIHFNVSHSGDLILLAVSEQRAVGVDVERRRPVERVEAMTRRWLSSSERGEMERLVERGASPSDAFLRVWSLKEARLKALGVGIVGSSGAALQVVDARALDVLLDPLGTDKGGSGYVGAVAFA